MGDHIDAKMFPKAALEKVHTLVSKNRYIYPMIDFFWTIILSLLASTGHNVQVSFLYTRYHVPPLQFSLYA